jgi:helix-turn-helix protein
MASIAHEKLRKLHDDGAFSVTDLARRVGCHRGAIRDALAGSQPKVALAVALERELGIPVTDWTTTLEETT